jgi:hypothetical protein
MGRAQDLVLVIRKARDEAKALLTQLETHGHPETNQSSSLYLALVSMQKRLTADPPPPRLAPFGTELEQLLTLCEGKLAPIKPLLEEALRIAR